MCGANLLLEFTQERIMHTICLVPHGQSKLIGRQEKLRSPKRSFRQPAGSLTKLFASLSCPPLINIHAEHLEWPWYESAQMENRQTLFNHLLESRSFLIAYSRLCRGIFEVSTDCIAEDLNKHNSAADLICCLEASPRKWAKTNFFQKSLQTEFWDFLKGL